MNKQNSNLQFVLAALVFSLSLPAAAQTRNFVVAQNGKAVGTASFSATATAQGYDTNSVVRVSMQGLAYSLSKTEQLTPANELRHVQVSALVNNSAVNVTATPDPAQFLLNVSANGKSSTSRLALHQGTVFLPDFDPGALQTLLALAVSRNNRDLWAILPKQAGTQAGSIVPVQMATYADEKGTLEGKAIAVHHLVATIGNLDTVLFTGPGNDLLQAELPQEGFALVRKDFVLKPPAKAGAPPPQQPDGADPDGAGPEGQPPDGPPPGAPTPQ